MPCFIVSKIFFARLQNIMLRISYFCNYASDKVAGARVARSGGGSKSKRALQNWRTDTQLSRHFPAFLGKILILPTCRILINSFYLVFKESRKPPLDKGGGLNRSKFQMYARQAF